MALSNHERTGRALDLLRSGLQPFVERELSAALGVDWQDKVLDLLPEHVAKRFNGNWDVQNLLQVMWNGWNSVFHKNLGQAERSIVSELRDARNKWAHQNSFNLDDTYRTLDSMQRLLTAISAPEAQEIDRVKQEVLRLRFEEQARQETRKAAVAPVEGQPAGGLRPWREIITPHPDVASGRYQQAEFAADLSQVHRGEGVDEYRDPRSFFGRTFLTEGLKLLLTGALRRLHDNGGDPVVELQTNFGGGKTHSMLALYHLFSGTAASEMAGVETILEAVGVQKLPAVQRAVLVGTATSPGQPHRKPDGTVVHTLWGDLAWQLLGKDGYKLVEQADKQGVSPGSQVLGELFTAASPCLILIDEWIAYVRQLYGVNGLPAGSFDANLSFAQALTEAAKAAPRTLIVASIPSSDIEIGGEGGHAALTRLRNVFARIESGWRPASAEESFEIVRRRLFQPIESGLYPARDAVVKGYMELYRNQSAEFPSECREADYERRLKASYPIHPELFDRLYTDWCSLDKFQRTRGVLRLMAAVIHELWERNDRNLFIMPASVPLDATSVQQEMTHYLDDPWMPVIDRDVDGAGSLPLQLDNSNPNLGRYSACRRVARTLFMGSAPTLHTAHKGLDDLRIKLGCVQPGETPATFGDALRRLTDGATHLYVDGQRSWFSTQPSVNRLAQERAAQQTPDVVQGEIITRLRREPGSRGDFNAVHPAPASGAEVPDEREARLVVLGPTQWHSAKATDSPARQAAAAILDSRGSSPRRYKNALVFLAPDNNRWQDLEQAVRQYLAWKSIESEAGEKGLNLDAFQKGLAQTKREQAEEAIKGRIPEAYTWLLSPGLPTPQSPTTDLEWQEIRLQGSDALAVRASKKLLNEELLMKELAGTRLRMELDRIPLWRGDHVGVKQLAEDFATYLYLPRLKDTDVLLGAIKDGVGLLSLTWEEESFGYADRWDEATKRYVGLRTRQQVTARLDNDSVIVKPEVALQQMEQTAAPGSANGDGSPGGTLGGTADGSGLATAGTDGTLGAGASGGGTVVVQPGLPQAGGAQTAAKTRFYGSVELDAMRVTRDVGEIASAVIQHLSGLHGAKVRITVEIEADIPDGVPDNVERTVTENCRTLKFKSQAFESE